MSAPKLLLDRVDKIYGTARSGTVHAVRGFDMDVQPGEIIALLGSSGCGKTSTLRMIAGFESVSAGSIRIDDREINRLAPSKRNVAMAFEGYSLYPPLTVRENIGFALASARLPKDEIARRVDEIAELLEITDLLDRYPVSISGGQQQRASLARALVRDADLHLLDEPMGQLEPQLRALLRGRLKHFIKERGLTAILVTHDQTEANALADRIAVMEGGEMQQYDTPERIKERPANLFSGTFIGEPPMNVFDADVTVTGEQIDFRLADSVVLSYPRSDFDASLAERLAAEGSLVVGFRPYAVKRSAQGVQAEVITNQWLGDQSHIATRLADNPLVMVEHDRADVRPGDSVTVAMSVDDLHLFQRDSGDAIAHGRELVGV